MKAIVVTDRAAGTAGMKLVERPEPQGAALASLSGANYGDVVVEVHASGFTGDELSWPSTWVDRLGRDRTPSIPGHELAGVVTALSYGTTGLSVGQRVFGLTDWVRDGTLAEYVAVEARNLAPLPGDVDFTEGAALVMSGLTAWQGLFEHGRLRVGQSVLVHGAAGVVGSMATQLAREAGAYVIGTGRAGGRQMALDFGAQEFVDLDNYALEDVGRVDLVFDVIGGDIAKRSAGVIRAGGTLVTVTGPTEARPSGGLTIDFVVVPDRAQLSEIVRRARDGRVRTNIGNVATLDDAVAAFNRTERIKGKTIIRVHPEDSGLPNAHEGAIHAPKESLDVEHDYADRFLSHACLGGAGNLLSRSRSPGCSHRSAVARLSVVFSYVPQSDSHACGYISCRCPRLPWIWRKLSTVGQRFRLFLRTVSDCDRRVHRKAESFFICAMPLGHRFIGWLPVSCHASRTRDRYDRPKRGRLC